MAKAKQLLEDLTFAGPHEVLRGDLALVGQPGVGYTPKEGRALPAVAFGHGWLQPAGRYRELLRHLASWGIVAAAPSAQRAPLARSRPAARRTPAATVRCGDPSRAGAPSRPPPRRSVDRCRRIGCSPTLCSPRSRW